MKNVIITGGLGNQMFQYALVLALRNRGFKVKMDISYYGFLQMHNGYELKRVFGINEPVKDSQGLHMYWLRTIFKFKPKYLFYKDCCFFDEKILKSPSKYLYGYWQDERYFKEISETIRKAFQFPHMDSVNANLAEEMTNCNSVSLHIRRGDYAEFGMNILEKDYYSDAVKKITQNVKNPFFYIFSDDQQVAKEIAEYLKIPYQIINNNQGQESYKDIYLMSHCHHNIIANSSFSWWAAWLNTNYDKIVISPKTWSKRSPILKPQVSDWILL